MKHAELAARNTEGGYWIAASDPRATEHAVTGDAPTGVVQRLGMLTDGAARFVELFGSTDWSTALDVLSRSGPRWFIRKLVRPVEAADPLGAKYPRNKCSDDATVVYAELAETIERVPRSENIKPQTQLDAEEELFRRLDEPTALR